MTKEKEEDLIEKVTQLYTIIAGNGLIAQIKGAITRIAALEEGVMQSKIRSSRWRDVALVSAGVVAGSVFLLLGGAISISDILEVFV